MACNGQSNATAVSLSNRLCAAPSHAAHTPQLTVIIQVQSVRESVPLAPKLIRNQDYSEVGDPDATVEMRNRSGQLRSSRAVTGSLGTLSLLDEDTLLKILHVVKGAGTLAPLASASQQLCRVARARVPLRLKVEGQEYASLLIRSHASGRPPFSGCTDLEVAAADMASCVLVGGVLSAAQPWAALEKLVLYLRLRDGKTSMAPDVYAASVLSPLTALRQLRSLSLNVPILGNCSAALIAQLTQLTHLSLYVDPSEEDAAADLAAMSGMTNLVELDLQGPNSVQPAAGAAGPFCIPSSVTSVTIDARELLGPAPMASWLTHLPGCPHLQHLELKYYTEQHPSAHPYKVVSLLARHNRQLRTLDLNFEDIWDEGVNWGLTVAGLPDAAELPPVGMEWRPTAALVALSELRDLSTTYAFSILDQDDWQQVKQLRALTRLAEVVLSSVPQLRMGTALVALQHCRVHLGGYDVGRLLLACPALQQASIEFCEPAVYAPVPPVHPPLVAHPTLQSCKLADWHRWGGSAAEAALGAAAAAALPAQQFAAVAPVLSGVADLQLVDWPKGSSKWAQTGLPDLSPCVAVTALEFGCSWRGTASGWEQEEVLLMLRPLVALRQLRLSHLPRVSARLVVPLQHMLLQLQEVRLYTCGNLLPAAAKAGNLQQQQQQEGQALAQLMQLLRPGLRVKADTLYWA